MVADNETIRESMNAKRKYEDPSTLVLVLQVCTVPETKKPAVDSLSRWQFTE